MADDKTDTLIGSFLTTLKESGEGAFNRLSDQLLQTPVFLSALQQSLAAKGQVDRTVSGTLDLVNLPSKNDVARVLEEIEALGARVGRQQRTLATIEAHVAEIKAALAQLAARRDAGA